jgi:hypothetical protein
MHIAENGLVLQSFEITPSTWLILKSRYVDTLLGER